MKRDRRTGKRLYNVLVDASTFTETSKTSSSMNRAPGPRNEGVKGCSTNLPFMPGWFKEENRTPSFSVNLDPKVPISAKSEEELFAELFDKSKRKSLKSCVNNNLVLNS